MKNVLQGNFYNPTKGNLKVNETIKEILSYIAEKPEKFYDVIVGCDSSSGENPYFPVVIVVLRTGEGGRFFLRRINYKDRKFYTWKTRVLEEVFLSCQIAVFLKEKIEKSISKIGGNLQYQFRYIHADVGESGQTKDMVKEVTGLIRGNGFEPKIKPEAFAATTVADKFS